MRSYYRLTEGNRYTFEFSTYSPYTFEFSTDFPDIPPQSVVKLLSEDRIFSTPSEHRLDIASSYDEERWTLVSSSLERDVWTSISFKTELGEPQDREPLNMHIGLLVKVRRKMLYRGIDIAGDLAFGFGTASIALSKALGDKWTWWYWPVIGFYAAWAICKATTKLRRG